MSLRNYHKYARGYFLPPTKSMKWIEKDYLDHAPIWCSVDLRDGNQALVVPMTLEEKLAYFQLLLELGFKEIEVGFPAASETEFTFLRTLIEENLIPDDVTIQVLTQSREHIIRKTFESLRGVKKAIVHLYNSTSVAQREQVFKKSKEEIVEIAVTGAKMVAQFAEETPGNFQFQYSPESFTGTEVGFALEICNAVLDVWQPTFEHKVIINLPATVSMSMPHVYASQIEYMSDHLSYRENVIISVHPHNDRGTGVADAELAMLAGGDRIEGTLFGNGERTGNVDLITLALNLFSHGIDPGLHLEDLPSIKKRCEALTQMSVSKRHPYAGELVFTAFSGSHQDAIAKGMQLRENRENSLWNVPYLVIDPKDIGREYEGDIIRINSQSGKGGIGYVLMQNYGLDLPAGMREALGYRVKGVSDQENKELMPAEIYEIFLKDYVNVSQPYEFLGYRFASTESYETIVKIRRGDRIEELEGQGNGRLDAISHALMQHLDVKYINLVYKEHALEVGSESKAVAYIGITSPDSGKSFWGCGIDVDIMTATIKALFSAVNQLKKA